MGRGDRAGEQGDVGAARRGGGAQPIVFCELLIYLEQLSLGRRHNTIEGCVVPQRHWKIIKSDHPGRW